MPDTEIARAARQRMLQPGTILLEKYRVERVLGKGGMGFVLAARHVHLGELFAIKTMLPEALQQPEALERFLREARACAKLKGEHVARVHDIGNLPDGTPYMLMEHLDGEDLGQILAQRGALPVEEAALYVHQACEAVAEAHAHGIVHRDLKPANLFLTYRPNGTPCVKVLDFGISKELDQANKVGASLTKTGTFLGSPMYMSPEQMADLKATDTRGDVWALGVILYEFVTGQAPFASEIVTAVVSKVLLAHPEPPSRLCASITHEFDAVVMRCLEKKPENRYPSAYELMLALEPFAGITPAPISPHTERSASISRSILIPHAELAETLANPVSVPSMAVAETIRSDEIPSVADGSTILPVENENPSANDKPADASESGGRRRRLRAGVALGACALLGMGFALKTTSAPTPMTTPTTPSAARDEPPKPPSPVVQPSPAEQPVPADSPNPIPTLTNPEASSRSPNEPAPAASPQSSASKTPAMKAPRATPRPSPGPASTSRRATNRKSRVPGYDD